MRTLTFAIGTMLIASLAPPSDAKPRVVVRGVVTDEADNPIPNVLIELTCARKGKAAPLANTKSNSEGHFQLEATVNEACNVKITAPGFSTALVPIRPSGNSSEMDLGKIRLRVSCSGPGVVCDEVTPTKEPAQETGGYRNR